MISGQFSSDPNKHNAIENRLLQSDSSLVKRKFLYIPYTTLSFSQKLENYLPDEGGVRFLIIPGNYQGTFFGLDKSDMHVTSIPKGLIENVVHLDFAYGSIENIDNIFQFIKTSLT